MKREKRILILLVKVSEHNEFTHEQILECHYDFRQDLDNHFESIRIVNTMN